MVGLLAWIYISLALWAQPFVCFLSIAPYSTKLILQMATETPSFEESAGLDTALPLTPGFLQFIDEAIYLLLTLVQ